jgi:hypothetical protein
VTAARSSADSPVRHSSLPTWITDVPSAGAAVLRSGYPTPKYRCQPLSPNRHRRPVRQAPNRPLITGSRTAPQRPDARFAAAALMESRHLPRVRTISPTSLLPVRRQPTTCSDAAIAAWSATRHALGNASSLPSDPPTEGRCLSARRSDPRPALKRPNDSPAHNLRSPDVESGAAAAPLIYTSLKSVGTGAGIWGSLEVGSSPRRCYPQFLRV